jgi:mono/diheme cytochrome c family protein
MRAFSLCIAIALPLCASASFAKEEPAERIAAGKQLYEDHCVACHGAGPGFPPFPELPGTAALRAKYGKDVPALLADRTDLTPEFVAHVVRNGMSVMPFYRRTEISDADLSALGAYLGRERPGPKNK